jgi:cysteine desulfurase / selenocysteine lyase
MNDTLAPLQQLAAVRREFPGTDKWIYFETSARGLLPAGAREAVARYLDDRILEGGAPATMLDMLERVRGKFARLIGADPDEVAIVKNVSEGLNAIVTSVPWQQGDNAVLCTDIEHPNSIYALYNMRDRHGVEVRTVPATADFATPIEAIAQTIDAKTRMVIASTVTYTTGARTDLDALANLCSARDILLLVDGAQSVGALELDMRKTLLDAMTVGASKYLCGPYGFGFLYVRRERAERMQPGNLARYGIDLGDAHEGEKGGSEYKLMPAARRFELGSYNYAAANAVDVSLDLIAGIGVPTIEHHVLDLARAFTAGLRELKLPVMSGKVGKHFSQVVIVGKPAGDTATETLLTRLHAYLLENRVKASIRHGRLRFAFHFYNTRDEVDRVLTLLRARLATTV